MTTAYTKGVIPESSAIWVDIPPDATWANVSVTGNFSNPLVVEVSSSDPTSVKPRTLAVINGNGTWDFPIGGVVGRIYVREYCDPLDSSLLVPGESANVSINLSSPAITTPDSSCSTPGSCVSWMIPRGSTAEAANTPWTILTIGGDWNGALLIEVRDYLYPSAWTKVLSTEDNVTLNIASNELIAIRVRPDPSVWWQGGAATASLVMPLATPFLAAQHPHLPVIISKSTWMVSDIDVSDPATMKMEYGLEPSDYFSWKEGTFGYSNCTVSIADERFGNADSQPIPAGTYVFPRLSRVACGLTHVPQAVRCKSDNNGSSTGFVTDQNLNLLVTAPIVAGNPARSGVVTAQQLNSGNSITWIIVADGVSKFIECQLVVAPPG